MPFCVFASCAADAVSDEVHVLPAGVWSEDRSCYAPKARAGVGDASKAAAACAAGPSTRHSG